MIQNNQNESMAFSMGSFVWWIGVVEDRLDPEMLGRVRVRIGGYHTADKGDIATNKLLWAYPMQPITSAAMNGLGEAPVGVVEGTWVVGFFRDGHNAHDPVIMGTLGGKPESKDKNQGFNDPNGVYPKDAYLGEPDTNRLARNEKIEETIVQSKKDGVKVGVSLALGSGNWDEPETPYAAEYPYNHVKETESGHVQEFDDTEGAERIHTYHKSGTFEEIHPDGTKVTKVVGADYEIVLDGKNMHVTGNLNITINGDANILVDGDCKSEVTGNKDEYIHGKYQLKVGGDLVMNAGGNSYLDGAQVHFNLPGPVPAF